MPNVLWIKHVSNEGPELTCSLTHLGQTVRIAGMLDTGADITAISRASRLCNWNLVTAMGALAGIGGAVLCLQSELMITVTGPKARTATIRPFVVQKPITVRGRDVLSQWGAKIEVDF
uniref:endogenous retrovirus group K member 19 Pro protein-like n=1 Tax=Agelaius phoeniceus TaxID=39638 RepID=UPI0023EBFA80|nr:endogenous retrovirus group K member 19 Pro protein-like [Agelaius phoeniceus]